MRLIDRVLMGSTIAALLATGTVLLVRQEGGNVAPSASVMPQDGEQQVVVLFLSGSCPACSVEPEASRLRDAIEALRSSEMPPRIIGVAVDFEVEDGLKILRDFGPFDEVIAGSGLRNTGALQYLWQDSLAFPAVPQLITFTRQTDFTADPPIVRYVDSEFYRVTGLESIRRWIENSSDER